MPCSLGPPGGAYTLGGKFQGTIPAAWRWAILFQIGVLLFFAGIVAAKSGLAFGQFYAFSQTGIWLVAGFFVVGTILNISTPSRKERNLWAPVNIAALVITVSLALLAG